MLNLFQHLETRKIFFGILKQVQNDIVGGFRIGVRMDMTENKKTGDIGEEIATEYLKNIGYKIIDRNLKLICGEIDILAKDKKDLVIVEVKTVRGSGFGLAQELVRFKKQKKLRQLGRALEQKYPNSTIRVDVVGVDLSNPSDPQFEHINNAVEA